MICLVSAFIFFLALTIDFCKYILQRFTMYLCAQENQFKLFSDLIPVSIVAPLYPDDEGTDIVRMYQCKHLFDSAVLRSRGLLKIDGDISVDGKFIGNINNE